MVAAGPLECQRNGAVRVRQTDRRIDLSDAPLPRRGGKGDDYDALS